MTFWDASSLGRGGAIVRRAAWSTDPLRSGAAVAWVAGAGTSRSVAVWRQNGAEVVIRPHVTPAVTGNATTDFLTSTRAMIDGEPCVFDTLSGGAGLVAGLVYYVRDVTLLDFKLALSVGGTAINFTSNITAGSLLRVGHIGAADLLADDWEVV